MFRPVLFVATLTTATLLAVVVVSAPIRRDLVLDDQVQEVEDGDQFVHESLLKVLGHTLLKSQQAHHMLDDLLNVRLFAGLFSSLQRCLLIILMMIRMAFHFVPRISAGASTTILKFTIRRTSQQMLLIRQLLLITVLDFHR